MSSVGLFGNYEKTKNATDYQKIRKREITSRWPPHHFCATFVRVRGVASGIHAWHEGTSRWYHRYRWSEGWGPVAMSGHWIAKSRQSCKVYLLSQLMWY